MKNPDIISTVSIDGGTNSSISTSAGPDGKELTLRSKLTLSNSAAGVFTGSTVVRVNII